MGWGGFIFHCNGRDTFLLDIQNIDYFNLGSEFYYNNFQQQEENVGQVDCFQR